MFGYDRQTISFGYVAEIYQELAELLFGICLKIESCSQFLFINKAAFQENLSDEFFRS
jgi:hypothetical protein